MKFLVAVIFIAGLFILITKKKKDSKNDLENKQLQNSNQNLSLKTRNDFMLELIEKLKSTDIDFKIFNENCVSGKAYKKGLTFYFVINKKTTQKSKYKIVFGLGINKINSVEIMEKQFEYFSNMVKSNIGKFNENLYEIIPNKSYGSFEVAYKGIDWSEEISSWSKIQNDLRDKMVDLINSFKPFIDSSPDFYDNN